MDIRYTKTANETWDLMKWKEQALEIFASLIPYQQLIR